MRNVIAMPAHTAAEPEPRHRRLQSRSRILAGVVTALLGAVLLLNGVILAAGLSGALFGGTFLSMGPDSCYLGEPPPDVPGIVLIGSLPLATLLAYAATLLLNTAAAVFALLNLRGLLRLYAAGIVFAAENGTRIKHIALALAGYAVAPFVGHELVMLAGHGVDMNWFRASEPQALVLGAVLFVIAQVMEVGQEIEQDRNGFV